MYFFIEKSKELQSRANDLSLDYNDIYVDALTETQENYSLPALHETADGYSQGDATDEEISQLVQELTEMGFNESNDVYQFLDEKLIGIIEDKIESLVKPFGNDEYSKDMFDVYKDKATELIREFLDEEYYQDGGDSIGQDYSVYFIADAMEVFEHIEAGSNLSFQHDNEARFNIVHLNNYYKAFDDFSDFVSEFSYKDVRLNFSNEDYEIGKYMLEIGVDEFDENLTLEENIIIHYNNFSFDEKMEMWEDLDEENIIEDWNSNERDEAIMYIIDDIDWDEIEKWFDSQFEQ
jgi:hypothetical protein